MALNFFPDWYNVRINGNSPWKSGGLTSIIFVSLLRIFSENFKGIYEITRESMG
jgi:hypothetical protein